MKNEKMIRIIKEELAKFKDGQSGSIGYPPNRDIEPIEPYIKTYIEKKMKDRGLQYLDLDQTREPRCRALLAWTMEFGELPKEYQRELANYKFSLDNSGDKPMEIYYNNLDIYNRKASDWKNRIREEVEFWNDNYDENDLLSQFIDEAIRMANLAYQKTASAISQNGGMGTDNPSNSYLIKASRSLKETISHLSTAEKMAKQ